LLALLLSDLQRDAEPASNKPIQRSGNADAEEIDKHATDPSFSVA